MQDVGYHEPCVRMYKVPRCQGAQRASGAELFFVGGGFWPVEVDILVHTVAEYRKKGFIFLPIVFRYGITKGRRGGRRGSRRGVVVHRIDIAEFMKTLGNCGGSRSLGAS